MDSTSIMTSSSNVGEKDDHPNAVTTTVTPASAMSSDQSLAVGAMTKAPPPSLLGYKTREEFEHAIAGPGAAVYGGHFYATSGQSVTNFGGLGTFSLFTPSVLSPRSWSAIQIGCGNSQTGKLQAVEAGLHVNLGLYGDNKLHLFTYYTTTGYQREGQAGSLNFGGYNKDGFLPSGHDPTYFPGMTFSQLSTVDGTQFDIELKWRLHARNWFLEVNGNAIGYYPESYFEKAGQNSLADYADTVAVWGEVYDPDNKRPKTQMGSGEPAGAGQGRSAYAIDMYIGVGGGVAQKYVGSAWSSDANLYSIDAHFNDPGVPGEGSAVFIGGPGAPSSASESESRPSTSN